MKKSVFLFGLISMAVMPLAAQDLNCLGLKNPTNFTFTGGNASSSWSGATGTKDNAVSTCTSLGMTFTAIVTAANMASQSSGSSCTSSSSVDINGNSDTYKRFVIKGSGTDPLTYNHLSYQPPAGGFTSSIRLGNNCGGTHEAEQLTYEFEVNNDNKLVTLWYALSLQNGQHDAAANPEFAIQVMRQVGSGWVLAAGDTLCYLRSTPDHSNSDVSPFYVGSTGTHTGASYGCNIYLPWTPVQINLDRLNGSRVRIVISTGDCNYSAHYGCAYIAGDCAPMALTVNPGTSVYSDTAAFISAPEGATVYEWYRSKTGVLQGAARAVDSNYVLIDRAGADGSTLAAIREDFIGTYSQERLGQNTFKCKITTNMNETLPITSNIYCEAMDTTLDLYTVTAENCLGGGSYIAGSSALIAALPQVGVLFAGWGDGETANPRTITVNSDTTLVALYQAPDTIVEYHHYYFDTTYIIDTIYITGEGVNTPETINAVIYSRQGWIGVEGAAGNEVTLYDLEGRMLATKRDEYAPLRFDVPASGVYLVKIGPYPARRVMVVK